MNLFTYGHTVMCEMPEDVQNILWKMAGNTEIYRCIVPCWSSSWEQGKILQGMAGGAGHLCTTNLIESYISIGCELAKGLDTWLTGRH